MTAAAGSRSGPDPHIEETLDYRSPPAGEAIDPQSVNQVRERRDCVTVSELTKPSSAREQHRMRLWTAFAASVGILLAWNVAAHVLPAAAQLPISVIGVIGLVSMARRAGLDWSDLGLARRDLGDGARVGAIAAGVLVLVLITASAVPHTRSMLADGRFVAMDLPRVLYETLVRIPLAVALAEEVAFRGVLLGMLMARMRTWRAVAISSTLFGLWHILPGITALESASGIVEASSTGATIGFVTVQVLLTGLAGVAFSWLRLRGQHIVSSVLVHAPLNSVTFAIGWIAVQNAGF